MPIVCFRAEIGPGEKRISSWGLTGERKGRIKRAALLKGGGGSLTSE